MGPIDWLPVSSNSRGVAKVTLPGSGLLVAIVSAPGASPVLIETRTTAGNVTSEQVALRLRPVVRGQILASDGSPAIGIEVHVHVLLDNEAFDFFDADRDSGIGIAGVGSGSQYNSKVSVPARTDSEGRFRVAVPNGREIAISAFAVTEYAFKAFQIIAEGEKLDLPPITLEGGGEAKSSSFVGLELVTESGEPVEGLRVTYAIQDDDPWYRAFPDVVTDQDGQAILLGIQPGTPIGVLIHRKGGPPKVELSTPLGGIHRIVVE